MGLEGLGKLKNPPHRESNLFSSYKSQQLSVVK
jgi:hypothetical protein